jgi:hypothetical protein
MSVQYGPGITECLYSMPAKGPAGTAATNCLTFANAGTVAGGAYQLQSGYFQVPSTGGGPGRALLIKGGGYWSVGTTADTLTFSCNLDTTAGTALAGGLLGSTGAITPVASTSGTFDFEIMVTATAMGVSAGVLQTVGHLNIGAVATLNGQTATIGTFSAGTNLNTLALGGVNAGLASFNTQQQYFVEFFGNWSATTGAPSVTLSNFYVFGSN